jgi:uncharacterized protein YqgV (UPF0045/DUF77 family)
MSTATLSLKVLPLVNEKELYPVVDKVISMLKASGLNYVISPNDTTVEGDLDTLLNLVKMSQQICVEAGAERVFSVITLDYKPSGVTIDEKIAPYRG